jgi:hypothetical protein
VSCRRRQQKRGCDICQPSGPPRPPARSPGPEAEAGEAHFPRAGGLEKVSPRLRASVGLTTYSSNRTANIAAGYIRLARRSLCSENFRLLVLDWYVTETGDSYCRDRCCAPARPTNTWRNYFDSCTAFRASSCRRCASGETAVTSPINTAAVAVRPSAHYGPAPWAVAWERAAVLGIAKR